MGRWEPNARERLEQAAMELFHERGYDRTTVEEIASRAGLTERTFFRYFADKREVLFWGSSVLEKLIVDTIAGAPGTTAPLDAVTAGLAATSPVFEPRRAHARKRSGLIAAHPELKERELNKLASLATAIAESLRVRGVTDPAAGLTAEAGISLFKLAFEQWVRDPEERELSHHLREALGALKTIISGGDVGRPTPRGRTAPRREPATGARKHRAPR